MNHFMLPSDPEDERGGTSARYGAFALQRLVSELVRHGAERARLEVKIFGGGQVLAGVTDIGQANIEFVRGFFASEGLTIVAEDVGDRFARRLRYHPRTGQAMVNRLPVRDAVALAAREHRLRQGMAERLRAKLPRVY
jgi:chemotaxis protein CheD